MKSLRPRALIGFVLAFAVMANASAVAICSLFYGPDVCCAPKVVVQASTGSRVAVCVAAKTNQKSCCAPQPPAEDKDADKAPCCLMAGVNLDQSLAHKFLALDFGDWLAVLPPEPQLPVSVIESVWQSAPQKYDHSPPRRWLPTRSPRAPPVACV